jgi:hypothetical protein
MQTTITERVTITEKYPNGNEVTYKIVNGTAYKIDTPEKVVSILENARNNRTRIRVFYGDSETGKDWMEEHDVIGYIGRSTGRIKIPLLIPNGRSSGGGGILDDCIVKITQNKEVVYQHYNYNIGDFRIKQITDDNLIKQGYTHSVLDNENAGGYFKSEAKANNYKFFMQGLRNAI